MSDPLNDDALLALSARLSPNRLRDLVRQTIHDRLADQRHQEECRHLMRLWWQCGMDHQEVRADDLRACLSPGKYQAVCQLIEASQEGVGAITHWLERCERLYPNLESRRERRLDNLNFPGAAGNLWPTGSPQPDLPQALDEWHGLFLIIPPTGDNEDVSEDLQDTIIDWIEARDMALGGGYSQRTLGSTTRIGWQFGFGLSKTIANTLVTVHEVTALRTFIKDWCQTRDILFYGGFRPFEAADFID